MRPLLEMVLQVIEMIRSGSSDDSVPKLLKKIPTSQRQS
jgi:hypothetical protein